MKLLKKEKLTHDVYELVFYCDKNLETLPGQFITFILPSGLRRAYSISNKDGNNLEFIVKRLEDGRGGSRELCDIEIGTLVESIGPVGHFILRENDNNKLFVGTGTGFAPLYFQVKKALESGLKSKMLFIFGVRGFEDVFYEKQLNFLKNKYTNFDFELFLSREDHTRTSRGYVTDYLKIGNIGDFDEFYICGSTVMVECSKQKIEEAGFKKEQIYFEKY
ncbi:MAG: FAD-dependent oxidoreductase [Candidatus Gracilibacteria bacterium]|nr:FAD-dependent oxidoreductase [Candidatus Gracilibacteria bacterium]